MATTHSQRRTARREQTVTEALDHAIAIMTEDGVGALTVSEVARPITNQPIRDTGRVTS